MDARVIDAEIASRIVDGLIRRCHRLCHRKNTSQKILGDGARAEVGDLRGADETGPRVAYPLRCVSSSWLPSALAGHSGRYSVIWA
jgi:hypothetical protein